MSICIVHDKTQFPWCSDCLAELVADKTAGLKAELDIRRDYAERCREQLLKIRRLEAEVSRLSSALFMADANGVAKDMLITELQVSIEGCALKVRDLSAELQELWDSRNEEEGRW